MHLFLFIDRTCLKLNTFFGKYTRAFLFLMLFARKYCIWCTAVSCERNAHTHTIWMSSVARSFDCSIKPTSPSKSIKAAIQASISCRCSKYMFVHFGNRITFLACVYCFRWQMNQQQSLSTRDLTLYNYTLPYWVSKLFCANKHQIGF